MPVSAAIETMPRMALTKTGIAGCMRGASGTGGGGPDRGGAPTPAAKQQTLKNKATAACHDEPMRQAVCQERLGANAAGHRHKVLSAPTRHRSVRRQTR